MTLLEFGGGGGEFDDDSAAVFVRRREKRHINFDGVICFLGASPFIVSRRDRVEGER